MAADTRAQEGMAQSRVLKQQADAVKRVRALELFAEGLPASQVAVRVGRDRKTVSRWREEARGVY